MSDPLKMSLEEYIAKNRLFIKEAPPRREQRLRLSDETRGTDMLRVRDRSMEPIQLANRVSERYRERSVDPLQMNNRGRYRKNVTNAPFREKRVVQELPRKRSVTRYQGVNDISERFMENLKNNLKFEEDDEGAAKLFISNLPDDVKNRDITDLFSEFGKLKSSSVHYSPVGKPLGTADVIFENEDAATEAMKEYNGVPLDGKPMSIEMMNTADELGIRKDLRQDWRGRWDDRRKTRPGESKVKADDWEK